MACIAKGMLNTAFVCWLTDFMPMHLASKQSLISRCSQAALSCHSYEGANIYNCQGGIQCKCSSSILLAQGGLHSKPSEFRRRLVHQSQRTQLRNRCQTMARSCKISLTPMRWILCELIKTGSKIANILPVAHALDNSAEDHIVPPQSTTGL